MVEKWGCRAAAFGLPAQQFTTQQPTTYPKTTKIAKFEKVGLKT